MSGKRKNKVNDKTLKAINLDAYRRQLQELKKQEDYSPKAGRQMKKLEALIKKTA